MNGLFSIRNVLIFSALAFVFFVVSKKANKTVEPAEPQPSSQAVMETPAPVQREQRADARGTNKKKRRAISKVVTETPGCQSATTKPEIEMTLRQARHLAAGKRALVLIDKGSSVCIRKEEIYNVFSVRRGRGSGILFVRDPRGTATVTKIREINLEKIPRRASRNMSRLDSFKFSEALKQAKEQNGKGTAYLLNLKTRSQLLSRDTYGTPFRHPSPLVETVGKEAIAGLSSGGAEILDIRPATHFKSGSLPRARHFPLRNYRSLAMGPMSPRLFSKRSLITPQMLPSKMEQTLVIVGNGPADFASYNLATFLALTGYTAVKWYRGGIDDWYAVGSETPKKISGVKVVEPEDLVEVLEKGEIPIVDVRSDYLFSRARARGAVLAGIQQQLDGRGRARHRPADLIGAELLHKGEGFTTGIVSSLKSSLQSSQRPDGPVLVMGQTEHDWKGAKAAALLAQSGFPVYWLRGGYRAWLVGRTFKPKLFAVEAGGHVQRKNVQANRGRQAKAEARAARRRGAADMGNQPIGNKQQSRGEARQVREVEKGGSK